MPHPSSSRKPSDAEAQLQSFINKFEPKHQSLIRAARKALRQLFPTATELVYDNYTFFSIDMGPSEHPSDCILSLSAAANGVSLTFTHGASLPDPEKILLGSGKQTRFIRLPSAQVLALPAVQSLLGAAAQQAKAPWPAHRRGRVVIRSISAKQRPRRRSPKA